MDQKNSDSPYSKGLGIGGQIVSQMLPRMQAEFFGEGSKEKVNTSILLDGLEDAFNKKTLKVANASALLDTIAKKNQAVAQKKHQETLLKQYGPQKAEAEKFLASNKTKPGVVTTASGLEYKIEKKGTGPLVKGSDRLMIKYKGTLINDSVFDQKTDPITIVPDQMIPGWKEALPLMNVGSKFTLYIPYNLAYGPDGRAPKIPPFSTLVFDVEIVSIAK